jgi:hypothetical protein
LVVVGVGERLGVVVVVGDVTVDRGLEVEGRGKLPRLSRRRVSAEKKLSSAFSHEHEVGREVKDEAPLPAPDRRPARRVLRPRRRSVASPRHVLPDAVAIGDDRLHVRIVAAAVAGRPKRTSELVQVEVVASGLR